MPESKPIVIVCGLGRSGSSLMMRMLHHGGIPVICDANNVLYESHLSQLLPDVTFWLKECEGAALKILDPFIYQPPRGHNYRFIWMSRDFTEQAKSHLKFQRDELKMPVGTRSEQRKRIRDYITQGKIDQSKAVNHLISHKQPIKFVTFEDIILRTRHTAQAVKEFLDADFDLDIDKMVNVVVPRSTKNFNGFLEQRYVIKG